MIEIYNPWGSEKYKGAFSDGDVLWTQAAIEKTGAVNDTKDGRFFLSDTMFLDCYNHLKTLYYKEHFLVSFKTIPS